MSSFSSWGVPGNLSMKPEITAPGGSIYSLEGTMFEPDAYTYMSGTSMASPQVAGLTALVKQYLEEQKLSQPGLTNRALTQSLLMSTAEPMLEEASGYYYSILRQGAGLAAVDQAIGAASYILVDGQPDGKVKAELEGRSGPDRASTPSPSPSTICGARTPPIPSPLISSPKGYLKITLTKTRRSWGSIWTPSPRPWTLRSPSW